MTSAEKRVLTDAAASRTMGGVGGEGEGGDEGAARGREGQVWRVAPEVAFGLPPCDGPLSSLVMLRRRRKKRERWTPLNSTVAIETAGVPPL